MEFLDSRVLLSAAENLGIEINDGQLEKLEIYARLLCQWNEKMNLTAITSPEGIALLHFADSLTLLRTADFKEGASFADVGTGAGFPSIPLAVMRPDMRFTLIASLALILKRCTAGPKSWDVRPSLGKNTILPLPERLRGLTCFANTACPS